MRALCCLAVTILALLNEASCSWHKKFIYITKNGRSHRLSDTPGSSGSFVVITGENVRSGEIPYFTGYSGEESVRDGKDGWGDQKYCKFDKPMYARRSGNAWFLSSQWRRNSDRVYVSQSDCDTLGTEQIYYAKCFTGRGSVYGRVGTSSRLCGSDTTDYHGSFYAYVGKPLCKALGQPLHGDRWATTGSGRVTHYTYSCNQGYRRSGPEVLTCGNNGRWSSPPPTCRVIECPALPPPAHGQLSSSDNTYNTRVSYVCNGGYQQEPAGSQIQCQFDGTWTDATYISCKPVDCQYPVTPSNGGVRLSDGTKTTYNERARFYCDQGYLLEGASTATCGAQGAWAYSGGTQPSCTEIKCPALGHPQRGTSVGTGRSLGAQRAFVCDTGYTRLGARSITCTRQGNTGVWSDNMPTCTILNCPAPTAPDNGQVLGRQYTYGSEIRFMCNTGFRLQGADRATCQTEGWDAAAPSCTGIACSDPGKPDHGSRDAETFSFDTVVTFTCDAGYTRSGPESITCLDTGRWSGRRPQCEPVECPRIRAPQYGSRDGDQTEFPAKVTFTCFPGYQMTGESETSCQANGRWSNDAPTCTACGRGFYRGENDAACIKCPRHSSTVTEASATKAHCTCVDGSSGPQGGPCTVVECDPLVAPEHGSILPCNREQDSECVVECDAGYIMSAGTRRRRCTADGWTGQPAVCTVCAANRYRMHVGSTTCQPCPTNTVTRPGSPAEKRESCVCAPGFRGPPGGPCVDINECLLSNGGCSQECENKDGGFTCSCTIPGYILDADGKTCMKNQTCAVLDTEPNNGFLSCRYTERTNGWICFIKCLAGHFFVSGQNDYLTCGSGSNFQWSHQRVNSTARIPACTREFFIDVDLPIHLTYRGSAGCTPPPLTAQRLQPKLVEAINTIPQCRNKCDAHDVTVNCTGTGSDTEIKVRFDLLLFNPHPNEVPLNCTTTCKRQSMIQMLRDSFAIAKALEAMVETRKSMLELPGAPTVDDGSYSYEKPQLLCDPGQVQTSTRLCVPCDKGYYLSSRDLTMCEPCPVGTYQDEQGQVTCKSCLSGSTTADAGADHPIMCNVEVKKDNQIRKRSIRATDDVTEENAAAILDNPMLGL